MRPFDPECTSCLEDLEALNVWRIKGGKMPDQLCPIDHRVACKGCGKLIEKKRSQLCDDCWSTSKKQQLAGLRGAFANACGPTEERKQQMTDLRAAFANACGPAESDEKLLPPKGEE